MWNQLCWGNGYRTIVQVDAGYMGGCCNSNEGPGGDPKEDKEFLEEWSPSNHADKIKAPVFMAYGRQDPRVVIKHADVMEKALKANGVKYELMVKGDEGHGFRKQENIYDFYGRMETFLAENLNP